MPRMPRVGGIVAAIVAVIVLIVVLSAVHLLPQLRNPFAADHHRPQPAGHPEVDHQPQPL